MQRVGKIVLQVTIQGESKSLKTNLVRLSNDMFLLDLIPIFFII